MKATMLFPGDYYSLNNPNDNFISEIDAVIATQGLEATLFNYDEFIGGEPLRLNKEVYTLPSFLIYRGWMMKPDQYERFYKDLRLLGFNPITSPIDYERMHCFPKAGEVFDGQTPKFIVFPEINSKVEVDVELINATFDRFMVKDYVKSVKNTAFPAFFKTPLTQEEIDALIDEFISIRGLLFTGGIVLKEYVDLKRYQGGVTNEWRYFSFENRWDLELKQNSDQPDNCSQPPHSLISTRNKITSPFYSVDYAELEDGSWTVIEAGDGQVSGLASSDNPTRFYERMRDILAELSDQ